MTQVRVGSAPATLIGVLILPDILSYLVLLDKVQCSFIPLVYHSPTS